LLPHRRSIIPYSILELTVRPAPRTLPFARGGNQETNHAWQWQSAGRYAAGNAVNRISALCCLVILCGSLGVAVAAEATGQQRAQSAGRSLLGTRAPRRVVTTIDGDVIDLGSLYGKKAVYLKFWATWCVPCREQMPHFEHAYETAGSDLAVIAIDVGFNDSVDAVRAYRKKLGITMPIVFDDGSLGSAFHLRVTPTHVVIGRDGRVLYVGHLADKELDDALLAARAGTPALPARHAGAVAKDSLPVDSRPVEIGDLLPDRSLRTLDGRRFDLRRGDTPQKLTILVFLSPWCESYLAASRPQAAASCRSMRSQFTDLAVDPGVRWLGIASGLWANSADLSKYRTENKVTIPLTLDASGDVFRTFRVNDVPTVLIADARGRVVRRVEASAAQDPGALRAAVDAARRE
jgi:thiol-disulfide isomerase/thioredoxin